MYRQIKLRAGTAAAWTAANPVLLLGEPGVEVDTGKIKIGDGVLAWSGLGYWVDALFTGALLTKLNGVQAGAEVNTVDSVHGRTGNVIGEFGDYTADLIDDTLDKVIMLMVEREKLGAIEAEAQKNPQQVSGGEKTAGTETALRSYSPSDIKDMIAALAAAVSGVSSVNTRSGAVTLSKTDVGLGSVIDALQIRADFAGYASKATPDAADKLVIMDVAGGNVLKTITCGSVGTGGGGSTGVMQEVWATGATIGSTADLIDVRDGTGFALPANGTGKDRISVINNHRTGAAITVTGAQSPSVVKGAIFATDATAYAQRYSLSTAVTPPFSALTCAFWFRASAADTRVLWRMSKDDNNQIIVRMSGDHGGSNQGQWLCFQSRVGGTLVLDKRFLVGAFGVLRCVAVSLDINAAASNIQCLVDGVAVPASNATGTTWVQTSALGGTQEGSTVYVGGGFPADSRRAWYGSLGGLSVWAARGLLTTPSVAALVYDGGPVDVSLLRQMAGVSPLFVFNGAGTSFANPGTMGGTWTNAKPAEASPLTGASPDQAILEQIAGYASGYIQAIGQTVTYVRNAAGGRWRAL